MTKFLISLVVVSNSFPEVIARDPGVTCSNGVCYRTEPSQEVLAAPATSRAIPIPAESLREEPRLESPVVSVPRSVLVPRENSSRVGILRRCIRLILRK